MSRPATEAWRGRLVTLLALHSGMTDAIGFVALGGAFTSVMTGNMVLIGVGASQPDAGLAVRAGAAVVAFAGGCGIGARVAAHRTGARSRSVAGSASDAAAGPQVWPHGVTRALTVQLVLTAVFAAGWWLTGSGRGEGVQLGLLIVNAACLGLQSSAVQRFGVPGLSTTYLTGTLTSLVVRLATGGRPGDVAAGARLLGALIVGAGVGALLAGHAPGLVPVGPLACLGTVLLAVRLRRPG